MEEVHISKKQKVVEKCQNCENSEDTITLVFVCVNKYARGVVIDGVTKIQLSYIDYLLECFESEFYDFEVLKFYLIDLLNPSITLEKLRSRTLFDEDDNEILWLDKVKEYMGGSQKLEEVFLSEKAKPSHFEIVDGIFSFNEYKLDNISVRWVYFFKE